MKTALVVGMASGAVVGFVIGVKFESQVLRDLSVFQSMSRNGMDVPFLVAGGLFAGIGAMVGAGMAYIFPSKRR